MLLVSWLLMSPVHAQIPTGSLEGTYALKGRDGPIVVRIELAGSQLTGTLDAPGTNTITFRGSALGRYALGTISSVGGTGDFEALVDGDTLTLVLAQREGPGQPAVTVPLTLHRVIARPAAQSAGSVPAPGGDSSSQQGDGGDVRLVGAWVRQTVASSGDESMALEEFLVFEADGSYAYGRRTVGSGAGWSFETGGGPTERGRWRAENGTYYILQS